LSKVVKSPYVAYDSENFVQIEVMRFPAANASADDDQDDFDAGPDPAVMAEQAAASAKQILDNAKSSAQKILADARTESAALAQKAEDAARIKGYDEGYLAGEAAAAALTGEAQTVLENARREREVILASAEPEMVDLVVKSIQKLLTDTIAYHPDTILYIIRKGLAAATMGGDIKIRVSAEDYETVHENREQILALAGGEAGNALVKDAALSPGDCVIETDYGNIDCGLGQQFESLKENLYYIRGGEN